MVVKEIHYKDFLENKSALLQLLIDSYESNFYLSKEHSTILGLEKMNLIPDYLSKDSAILIGAFESEILVGFIWMYAHSYFEESRLHINQIVVSKRYRGQGIGGYLMNAAERVAKKMNINIIDLNVSEANSEAMEMYKSRGFMTERRHLKKVL